MSIKIKKIAIGTMTFLIFCSALFLYHSCSDLATSPENEPFSFKVKVVDSSKNPLSNLKIGVYFHFDNQLMGKDLWKVNNTNYGSTRILFSVKSVCKLTLVAYDLENKTAAQIIHNEKLNAGNYAADFITGDLFPGVYKCVLEAKDTMGNNTLFRDLIYAVLWHKDPVYNGIGFTDNEGIFETGNKLYFPALYSLPELIRTLENGPEPVGTFGIEDSVTLLVTDTTSNLTSRYTRKLGKNSNTYELIFPGTENEEKLIGKRNSATDENENKGKRLVLSKPLNINSVGLEYFNATPEAGDIHLNWKTNWEINNTGFEIQRYNHHSEFYAIGFVPGQGTTNREFFYSFMDQNLIIGDYMYRLKIIEFDGSFEYSDTAVVSIILPTEFSLYQNFPNPFN